MHTEQGYPRIFSLFAYFTLIDFITCSSNTTIPIWWENTSQENQIDKYFLPNLNRQTNTFFVLEGLPFSGGATAV